MNGSQAIDRAVPSEMSQQLKALGFDPGIPVYEIAGVSFPLGLVKSALFDSTYLNPTLLPLRSEREADAETPIGRGVNIVVEMVQAVYLPLEPHVGSGVFGCHEAPEWYVRGFLYMNPVGPGAPVCVHLYLTVDGGTDREKIEIAMVQFVHEPSKSDPGAELVYA
jgi:hypothetical protein